MQARFPFSLYSVELQSPGQDTFLSKRHAFWPSLINNIFFNKPFNSVSDCRAQAELVEKLLADKIGAEPLAFPNKYAASTFSQVGGFSLFCFLAEALSLGGAYGSSLQEGNNCFNPEPSHFGMLGLPRTMLHILRPVFSFQIKAQKEHRMFLEPCFPYNYAPASGYNTSTLAFASYLFIRFSLRPNLNVLSAPAKLPVCLPYMVNGG